MERVNEHIRKVVASLGVSEDKAISLLIIYKWNQERVNTEYEALSSYFVTIPEFNSRRGCGLCSNRMTESKNMGCGHYACPNCIKERIEDRILLGELEMMCPDPRCGKFMSHEFIKSVISQEARAKYDEAILQHFNECHPRGFFKRVGGIVVDGLKIFGDVIVENKKALVERAIWLAIRHFL